VSGPRIIAGDDTFRIVRIEDGDRVSHVMELADGADSLGVERWRDARMDNKGVATTLFNYIIKSALQKEK
jgi:hypothetical protein